MTHHGSALKFAGLLLLQSSLSVGCAQEQEPPPSAIAKSVEAPVAPAPQFHVTATLQELMDAQVDPAADFLWESVASISTEKGLEERRPRTDDEWKEVRRSAIRLSEASNLLAIPGRKVSRERIPAGGNGELDSQQIQAKIEANWPAFVTFAELLRVATSSALRAIDEKNAEALLDVGGTIDEACEACHRTFWYPDVKLP